MSRGPGGRAFPQGRENRTRGCNSKVLTKQIAWCENWTIYGLVIYRIGGLNAWTINTDQIATRHWLHFECDWPRYRTVSFIHRSFIVPSRHPSVNFIVTGQSLPWSFQALNCSGFVISSLETLPQFCHCFHSSHWSSSVIAILNHFLVQSFWFSTSPQFDLSSVIMEVTIAYIQSPFSFSHCPWSVFAVVQSFFQFMQALLQFSHCFSSVFASVQALHQFSHCFSSICFSSVFASFQSLHQFRHCFSLCFSSVFASVQSLLQFSLCTSSVIASVQSLPQFSHCFSSVFTTFSEP